MIAFQIRPAVMADVPAIGECVTRAYEPYIERMGKPPGPMLDDYSFRVENGEIYVIRSGNKVAGVLVLIIDDERCLLDNVAVMPEYQGKGWGGGKLVQFAERRATELNFDEIVLYTHEVSYFILTK